MQTLDVGEPATIASAWYDNTGTAAEPSAITLTIHPPSGADIVKHKTDHAGSSSGSVVGTDDVWSYTQTATTAGLWRYDVEGVVGGVTVKLPSGVFLVGVDTSSGSEPCEPWCTWEDVVACAPTPTLTAAGRELVIDQASELLFNLSSRKYPGLCTTTRSLCFACGICAPHACSCIPYPSIDLGGRYPVHAAFDVVVAGKTLDPSAYIVRGRRYLVRLDGQVWPSGVIVVNDPTAFQVTWVHGRKPPSGGRVAAAQLALQIAKLCANDKSCQLPQRVTQIQREGISYTILDNMKMIGEGRTGLASVDLWLVADARGATPPPHAFYPGLAPSTSRLR